MKITLFSVSEENGIENFVLEENNREYVLIKHGKYNVEEGKRIMEDKVLRIPAAWFISCNYREDAIELAKILELDDKKVLVEVNKQFECIEKLEELKPIN